MHNFPFNQPDKTRDCGYRCLYWALKPARPTIPYNGKMEAVPYAVWLDDNFKVFNPVESGITFDDIHHVLKYHNKEHRFTQLSESGLYIVYSGVWMHQYDKKHGHYFCYDNGIVYCSTRPGPEKRSLEDVISKLEAKTIDGAFRCLKIY